MQKLTVIDTDELVLYALDSDGQPAHQLAPTKPNGVMRVYLFESWPQFNSTHVPQR